MADGKRVAVIGSGISGLCAVKSCLEEGLEPVCFEQFDNIGGVWYYTKEYREGQGARMYEHLTTNSCKDMAVYSDLPFSREAPVYLTCDDVFRYLNSYCDHFGLRKYIHLDTKVKNISKADDYETTGKWLVETVDSFKRTVKHVFDFVMVCAGFTKQPTYPDIPGMDLFQGSTEHSMTFKDASRFKDKRVLVVGNGFSAIDVATFASEYATRVYLSVGSGMLILPKTLKNGTPLEFALFTRALFSNPDKAMKVARQVADERIDHDKAGLSPSGSKLIPKICPHDHIQIQIYTGKVKIVPRLVRLGPHEAELEDGTVLSDLDNIIYATGFTRKLDFLDTEAKGGTDKLTMYKMMFPLQLPHFTLSVIGCVDTVGPFSPIAELQSRIATRVFSGRHSLPSRDVMKRDVDRWNQMLFQIFGAYKHVMPNVMFRNELADELGVSPSWWDLIKAGPRLAYLYYYGPAFPYHDRLWGPHQWSGARQAIDDALQYGHFTIQPRKITTQRDKTSNRIVILTLSVAITAISIAILSRMTALFN